MSRPITIIEGNVIDSYRIVVTFTPSYYSDPDKLIAKLASEHVEFSRLDYGSIATIRVKLWDGEKLDAFVGWVCGICPLGIVIDMRDEDRGNVPDNTVIVMWDGEMKCGMRYGKEYEVVAEKVDAVRGGEADGESGRVEEPERLQEVGEGGEAGRPANDAGEGVQERVEGVA